MDWENAKVTVSSDKMTAHLYLPQKKQATYGFQEIMDILKDNGINYGIDEEAVRDIIDNNRLYEDVEVARGKQPVDGEPGYYDYFFETELPTRPEIKADGSVDYRSMHLMELVERGQVIAKYNKAKEGENGTDVLGNEIKAKRGEELAGLVGSGFVKLDDGITYMASSSGKIELRGNKIMVSSVFVVKGDLDFSVGNIDFNGDVIVRGNMCTSFSIKARGNVEIEGLVENARIEAGQDVVIKGGMNGNKQGTVIAGGNISGTFFEGANLMAAGDINANYLYQCMSKSDKSVIISGKYGKIIGGKTSAKLLIEANTIGSESGIDTVVCVGADDELLKEYATVTQNFNQTDSEVAVLKDGLKKFDAAQNPNMEVYRKVRAVYEAKSEERQKYMEKKQVMSDEIVRLHFARIIVKGKVNFKTTVISNMIPLKIEEPYENVYFRKKGDFVVVEHNE